MTDRFVTIAFVTLMLAGCSKPAHDVASVRGTVTIDGQPLAVGRVMFAPAGKRDGLNAGKPAFGFIQPDGSYVLSTYGEDDGAIVGDHSVTILGPAKKMPNATSVSTGANAPKFDRLNVPQRYSVAAGQENEIDIRLTAQDVARYGAVEDD